MVAQSAAQNSISRKLASALPYHYKEARPHREARREALKDYRGRTTYPGCDADDRDKQIVNLTIQAAEAHTMNLAASRPRFSVSSRFAQYEPFGLKMGRALDRYAEELYLEETLQEIVRDSFLSVGIGKCYQAASAAVGVEADYRMDPGRPFFQRISLDRFVWDTGASSPEECSFMGDWYPMPYREAIKTPRFSAAVRQQIREKGPANDRSVKTERGEDLGKSNNAEPIEDVIYLVDVFIRSKKAVWTFVCDRDLNLELDEPVQRVKWLGEECGPYYFLNMGPIPDHFMPSSPGQNLKLLNQLVNTLYRKLEDQARRQKILGTAAKGTGDAEIAQDAKDGEWVEFQEPQQVGNIRLDGPDQNIFGMAVHFDEQHSRAGGNLKHKLGLAQSADTASQERMIGAMSNRLEAFYQQRYVSFVRRMARGLARLIFNDAHLAIPGTFTIPGTEFQVTDDWAPYGTDGARQGEFDYYRVDIDPYSMGYQSPAERAAIMDADLQFILPLMPLLMQDGVRLNLQEFFEEKARLRGMPILGRLLQFNQPPFVPQEGGSGMGMLPGAGGGPNGQYTHTSRSTRSPESEAMQLFQQSQPQGSAA